MASDWDNGLFQPYMQRFMRVKYAAEGWPAECREEGVAHSELGARKQNYLKEIKDLYGINLPANEVKKNPGLRYIAKMAMNSLWGR